MLTHGGNLSLLVLLSCVGACSGSSVAANAGGNSFGGTAAGGGARQAQSAGSSGLGAGGSSAGMTSGGAGLGGAGESSAGTTSGGSGLGGAAAAALWSGSLGPWPKTCVGKDTRPAPIEFLTDLAGFYPTDTPPAPGESMSVSMNGVPHPFDHFGDAVRTAVAAYSFAGYSYNGSVTIRLPSLAPGSYSCPDATIVYNDSNPSAEGNFYSSGACCTVVVTNGGVVGELIEGTFSGIVDSTGLPDWVNLADGRFKVVLEADGSGGFGGAIQGAGGVQSVPQCGAAGGGALGGAPQAGAAQ